MMSEKTSNVLLGIVLGMLIFSISNFFGEQRYSDAIRECIREKGPNK